MLNRKRGFSLVEMLIVVIIISFLSLAVSFGTTFLAARAETASSMQILKNIANAIAEVERNGVNVVVRQPGSPSAGGAINSATGMFSSGQAEIEAVLGYPLTSLSEYFRFARIATAQTVGGKTWTRDVLRMWLGELHSNSSWHYIYSKSITITGFTIHGTAQPIEIAIPWDKWEM